MTQPTIGLSEITDGILEDRETAQQSTQDTPRVYSWPDVNDGAAPLPHLDLTTVHDHGGITWHRHGREWACDNDTQRSWHDLLHNHGPLTEIASTGRPGASRVVKAGS